MPEPAPSKGALKLNRMLITGSGTDYVQQYVQQVLAGQGPPGAAGVPWVPGVPGVPEVAGVSALALAPAPAPAPAQASVPLAPRAAPAPRVPQAPPEIGPPLALLLSEGGGGLARL